MPLSLKTRQSPGQLLREAMASLRTSGKRSILALLGIAMASTSVIAMINIGHNATADAMAIFSKMGTDTLIATIDNTVANQARLPTRLNTRPLLESVPSLSEISPVALNYAQVMFQGRSADAQLVGATADIVRPMNLAVRQGRLLNDFDLDQTYVVLGDDVARALGSPGYPLRPGDLIRLNGYLFTVIGLLHRQHDSMLIPIRVNSSIFIPLDGIRRVIPSAQISDLILRSIPDQDMTRLALAVKRPLEQLLEGRSIEIRYAQQMIDSMNSQSRTFDYLLIALSGISLAGAGVGIMNVMLMSVSQRRREIGVRMALGARRKDIRNLFLVEAMTLTFMGAVLGAVIGVVCSLIYARMVGWNFSLAPTALPFGVGSTLLVGLFCGLYPALAAARLQPVKALRDE